MIGRLLVNAAALAAATFVLPGITLDGRTWQQQVPTLLVIAVVFSLINTFVKPIVKVVSLPVTILSLGLFLWVINAGMLMLTSWVARQVGVGFVVDGWGSAFLGALIIAVVGALAGGRRKDRR